MFHRVATVEAEVFISVLNPYHALALTCFAERKERSSGESKEVFHYSAEDPGKV